MHFDIQTYVRMIVVHNIRYLLFAGVAFLLFYVLWKNKKSLNKIQQRIASRKDILRELGHSLFNGFIFAAAGYLLIKTPLRDHTKIYSDVHTYGWLYLFLSVVITLVLHDTYFYWMHRLMHNKLIFKTVHLVHHQSTNPTPFAAYSFHFIETIIESGVVFIFPFIVPLHPLAVMLFSTLALIINIYGHLGYEIMPRWFRHSFLFQIINTSVYHNLHHSKFKGNYGLYFRVWDRLLKTENPDYVKDYDKIQERRFGNDQQAVKTNSIFKRVAAMVVFLMLGSLAYAQIEGRWLTSDKTAIIQIYKENGKYFGKLVWTIPENQQKIPAGKTVMVLNEFEKKNETTFVNGTMNLVRRKKKINGTILLKNRNQLELSGTYMGVSATELWTRVQGL